MKKYGLTGVAVILALTLMLLSGCSKSDNFEPSVDCLYIRENGTVAEALFETLDKDYYSADSLQAFIEDAVTRYNSDTAGTAKAYEEDDTQLPVAIQLLEVDEAGGVKLVLDYASTKHYTDFNGDDGLAKQLSTGSVESALSVGVDLNVGLKNKDGEAVSMETIEKHGSYRVVLIQGVTDLQVQGKVMYFSDNVSYIDQNTVSVDAENEVAYIIFK